MRKIRCRQDSFQMNQDIIHRTVPTWDFRRSTGLKRLRLRRFSRHMADRLCPRDRRSEPDPPFSPEGRNQLLLPDALHRSVSPRGFRAGIRPTQARAALPRLLHTLRSDVRYRAHNLSQLQPTSSRLTESISSGRRCRSFGRHQRLSLPLDAPLSVSSRPRSMGSRRSRGGPFRPSHQDCRPTMTSGTARS
jgi:hypothetical protein